MTASAVETRPVTSDGASGQAAPSHGVPARSPQNVELRAAPISSTEPTGRGFVARVLSYGPADSYRTRWQKGVMNKSLEGRLPVLAWAHDWAEPIGRATGWHDQNDGLYLDFRLDDPAEVPRARQAAAQLRSGTITDISVGFVRRGEKREDDGTVTITEADLDECSLVLRAAVPRAEVVQVRSGSGDAPTAAEDGTAGEGFIVALAHLLTSGAISGDEARAILVSGQLPDAIEARASGQGQAETRPAAPAPATAQARQATDADIEAALALCTVNGHRGLDDPPARRTETARAARDAPATRSSGPLAASQPTARPAEHEAGSPDAGGVSEADAKAAEALATINAALAR